MFKGNSGDLNGFIDAGSSLVGELRFEDTFRIDGSFSGTIRSKGDLVVGAEGKIEGDVEVGQLFVSGALSGSVQAAKRVEIASTGRVTSDLATPALVIEEGAFFEGRCSMERGEAGPRLVGSVAESQKKTSA